MDKTTRTAILMGILLLVAALVAALVACDKEQSGIYTVGVINVAENLDESLVGFKNGMTELGYVEGRDIRYLYEGPTTEIDRLPAAARHLLAAKVDLLLTMTTPATLAAQKATAGTGLPVVFAIVTDPVGAGIVESISAPGGNVTGVTFGPQEARRLEWLVRIAPAIRKIYVPFNPNDKSPVLAMQTARSAALKLGVELIAQEAHDPETLANAVLNIPPGADAVFLLPDSYLGTRLPDLVATATKRNLPFSVANIMDVKNYAILTSFGIDQHLCGKQTARLADQIIKGAKPADLPVETAEFYLAINLKVAAAIGLSIPDEILRQADLLIR
jgi:putative ABC transport system substrate-binding protein